MDLSTHEGATLGFGQRGWDILVAGNHIAGAGNYIGVDTWVAIKAIDATAEVEAASNFALDDSSRSHFTLDGTLPFDDQYVTISQGDVVYGDFRQIRVDVGSIVMAYRGPRSGSVLNDLP